jgi:hypothetical protein
VAQVTIYLPDDVAAATRKQARRAKKSVSAWITELIQRETGTRTWARALLDVLSHGTGSLVEPDDLPAEDVEPLR